MKNYKLYALLFIFLLLNSVNASQSIWQAIPNGMYDYISSSPLKPTTQAITISRTWPSSVTSVDGWISYGIFIAVMFAWPIALAILAVIFMCCCCVCRCCCGLCGGAVKQDGYSSSEACCVVIPYGVCHIIVLAITIVCLACVIFSAISADTITKQSLDITNRAFSILKDVNTTLNGVVSSVDGVIDGVSGLVEGVNSVRVPLRTINTQANNSISQAFAIRDYINRINANFSIISEKIGFLSGDGVNSVDTSSINLPSSNIVSNSTINSLVTVRSQIDSADSTIQTVATSINSQVSTMRSSVKSSLNGVLGSLYTTLNSAQSALDQYLTPSVRTGINDGVTGGYIGIFTGFSVFYALFFILLTMGLLTVPCKCGCCLAFLLFLFNVFAIIYGIIAGLEIAALFFVNDVCQNHAPYIKSGESALTAELKLSLPFNISLSDAALNVARCSSNQTFLSAVGLNDLDKFNITSQITPYKNTILSRVDSFDAISIFANASSGFSNFTGSITVDFSVTARITNVSNSMDASLAQYSNYSRFGFDTQNFTNQVNTFNNILRQASYNGPPYTASNISSFNENDPLYASQTSSWRSDMANRRNAISNLNTQFVSITNQINQAVQNVTDMKNALTNIASLISQIQSSISVIQSTAGVANTEIGKITTLANQMKTNASSFIDNSLNTVTNSLLGNKLLQCSYIGDLYNSMITIGCNRVVPAIGIAGFASAVMVLVIAFYFIVLLELTKRVCNPALDVAVSPSRKEMA